MPRTVLVVDDIKSNRLILNEILHNDYAVLEAESGEQALDVLAREHASISAVLLDISMPGMDGYEVLTKIRASKLLSMIPVIMITGSDDRESRIRSLALGANDFVMKPYNSEILKHCLQNNIAFREAAARVSALQRDRLTGLFTRESFFDRARALVSSHEPGYYVIACFDIDRFKMINDQYGMQKGDEVLRHTADVFSEGFEPHGGICSRIAADNFAVLYPADFQNSQEIAEIRKRASHVEGLAAPIIFCIGRYVIDDPSMPPASMLDRAMLAAASVKGKYGEVIGVYDDMMRERLVHEQGIVLEMEDALKKGQFEVWYQPQFNHSTGALIGAEALVRWRHPDKGLIPPSEFIGIFEKNGFIYALDQFVWEEACRHLRRQLAAGRAPLPVSVNISRYDVFRPDMIGVVCGLVEKYQLPLDLMRLEITESAFAESSEHIVDVVKTLIAKGFTVEIDDFGSGYSSLNTLKDVPAQILKLDMKFLESSDDSERGGNIVESVVRMAKWLGMSVIAEGVETIEQADYLRSIGCSYIQGYLYAKPMPAAAYEAFCSEVSKEERLLALETVENLNNNAFWDPESMDTLIFNSYVGGACIFEYHNQKVELLRATEKYAKIIGSTGMSVEEALKLNWSEHLDEKNARLVLESIEKSIAEKCEVTGEYVFTDLPNSPHETYLRTTMRVIAAAGDRYLVYCTNENITLQRQSEKREQLAAKQLAAIMANISGGVTASVYEHGKLRRLFANDTYYRQLGFQKEEYEAQFSGTPDCIVPEDRDGVMALAKRLSETRESGDTEFRIKRPDGEIRWIKSRISIMDYPGETLPVQLAVTSDITEQRESELRAKRASEQLSAIMDNVDLGIIVAVLEGNTARYLFSNERYYALLGYTKEQFEAEIGSPYETVAPEDRARIMAETARINETGETAVLIYRVNTRDGAKKVFRAVISLGRFTGFDGPIQFTILRDITEETKVEEREKLAIEQTKRMMNDMPGGFVRMRVYGNGSIKPVYINDGFLKLTGMTHDEVMTIYESDALAGVHPDDLPIVNDALQKMFEKGEAHSARYRLKTAGGEYVWLSIFGRITKDISGDAYLNIYYTDASEEVREEAAQKDLLDNLPGGAGVYEFKDGQMRLKYQNKSYWELVGLNEAKFTDSAPMSAIHPDDVPILMRELPDAIEKGRDVVCDIRLKHLTKGFFPVHLVGRVVRKADADFSIYATFTPIQSETLTYQQMLPTVLSAIMDSTSDLSFAKDADFKYLTASRAFANMAGRESEREIIGKTDYDLFAKDMADKFRRDDEQLLESGRAIVDLLEAIPSADGTPHYSSTSKYLLRDGSGEIIGLYGSGRDVTKSVLQDKQLALVNDSVPGGIATYVYKDGNLRIAYCNDGFVRLFGGTREGFLARGDLDPLEWVLAEDRPELTRQILALVNDDAPMDVVFRIRLLGGGSKWINEKAVAAEREGDAVRFHAILLDVTERQSASELLRISEEENNLAVLLGGNIILRYNIADKSLTLMPEIAAAHSLPETIEDVPDEPVRLKLIAPESVGAYVGFFDAIRSGVKAASVLYQQKYFGDWRWMEGRSSTVFADDGKPVKAIISLLDVTERIEKETIYKKWQQSLEDRAPESYTLFRCNLNSNNTYETREGSLISFDFDDAGVSFDGRTSAYVDHCVHPDDAEKYLAFINSDAMLASYYRGKRSDALEYREVQRDGTYRYLRATVDLVESPHSTDVEAYMMFEDIDALKRAELKTKALSETDALTGLMNRSTFTARVNDILSLGKPDSRRALMMLDIDGFKQVNDVFGHAAGDQTLVDLGAGLRSMMRRGDLVGRLGGDEFVIFLNDVFDTNAVIGKAKQIRRLARRSFSMEVSISASIGIAFSPRDGMDFEALYKKADAALYYVKGSGKDGQAVYRDNMADEHLTPEPDAVDAGGTKIAEKKRRMLIVDDNRIDHTLLQNLFSESFIIENAKDGNSALIRLRHYGSAISVVLLDLMMPGMDGFAVLEKMQESAELRAIPVIIVSGDESRETCLAAIRKGATDFITKPVDAELLRLRVQSAVSKAENERLRAKNSLLEVQGQEQKRFEAYLDTPGITFIEYDWLTGDFCYYPSISGCLLGTYDGRKLWQILLSDMVADTVTVQLMQQLVHRVADDRNEFSASRIVELKTPEKATHRFRFTVRKMTNEYKLTNRLVITLTDLDCGDR